MNGTSLCLVTSHAKISLVHHWARLSLRRLCPKSSHPGRGLWLTGVEKGSGKDIFKFILESQNKSLSFDFFEKLKLTLHQMLVDSTSVHSRMVLASHLSYTDHIVEGYHTFDSSVPTVHSPSENTDSYALPYE